MVEANNYSYILITPAKNEELSLEKSIQSVVNQSKKPSLWLIMDDGSTDKTPEIIENAKKKYNWIRSTRLPDKKSRDLGIHYSSICRNGFNMVIKDCEEEEIKYEYIGLLDADIILDERYYENLIDEFIANPKLGIASGVTTCLVKDKLVYMDQRDDIPSGAARLWRASCFKETGGYTLTYSADSVSTIKAKLKGWETKRFREYAFVQSRMTSSVEGLWKGWNKIGMSHYYLGLPFTFAILRSVKYTLKKPYYIGLAYLYGYILFLLKKKQTDDKEVLDYYQHTRPLEITKKYFPKPKWLCK